MKWLSPLVLGLAAAVLGLNWGEIPERWPVHWGRGGHPNGWATKGVPGVFGPLLLGAALVAVFEITVKMIRLSAARQGAGAHTQADAAERAIRTVALAVTLVLAASAVWLPLARPTSPFGFVVFALVVIGAGVIGSVVQTLRTQAPFDPAVPAPEGWGKLVYRNPNDHRLWVPKRIGIGWTINFGHPMAWPMMLLLLALPIAIATFALFGASGSR